MECPGESVLHQFIAGGLQSDSLTHLEVHLDGCPDCQWAVAELARASGQEETLRNRRTGRARATVERGTGVGRYRVVEHVGSGAMGAVYAAEDPDLGRRVALKLLHEGWAESADPEADRARLLREAQALARLSSRHVISVFDVGAWQGRTFVAMELVDGVNFRQWLAAGARSEAEILEVLRQAARGLAEAHAAGLVHRDVKPDNILVGSDGRVRVTDFGLARTAADTPGELGLLVGTPAYMSPEQLEGKAADARSDQFSFCVTAWEALCGARPFAGDSLTTLRDSIRREAPVLPPGHKLAPRIRAPLLRGLSADPAARFPDMEGLLDAWAPRTRSRGWLGVAAGLAVLALIAIPFARTRARLCTGAAEHLAGVWDAPRRAAVKDAFAKTGLSYAPQAFAAAEQALDRYLDGWVAMSNAACAATRIRGEQSDEMLSLRMTCLEQRLREAGALVDLLSKADSDLVERAAGAASRLNPLDTCADARSLRAPVTPPAGPQALATLAALEERMAKASAARNAGRYQEALAQTELLLRDAEPLHYRPLDAELLLLLGLSQRELGQFAPAEQGLAQAVLAARAGGDADAEARAWTALMSVRRQGKTRLAEAEEASRHAQAALDFLGNPSRLAADLDLQRGYLLREQGKPDAALEALQRALTESPDNGAVLSEMGNVLQDLGKYAAAIPYHDRALAVLTGELGPDHPKVALATKNVGNGFWNAGQTDEALGYYRRALEIQIRSLGEHHLEVARTRVNVAAALLQKGQYEAASAGLLVALQDEEKALGPAHPILTGVLNNYALALEYQGSLDGAHAALVRALQIGEKAYGPEHPNLETTLINLGDVQLKQRDFAASAASYQRAAAIVEKALGPKHPNLVDDFAGEGLALLAMGEPDRAAQVLERSLQLGETAEADAVNLAKTRFALARAWWELGKNRSQTVAMAKGAREILAKSGERQHQDTAEVDAWLSKHAAR